MDRLFIIIFFFAFANLHSQSAISGEIKDSNGLPIEGVNIYLVGTIDGSTSNSNGIFSFETSEKGDVTLIASFIGYKDIVIKRLVFSKILQISCAQLLTHFRIYEVK